MLSLFVLGSMNIKAMDSLLLNAGYYKRDKFESSEEGTVIQKISLLDGEDIRVIKSVNKNSPTISGEKLICDLVETYPDLLNVVCPAQKILTSIGEKNDVIDILFQYHPSLNAESLKKIINNNPDQLYILYKNITDVPIKLNKYYIFHMDLHFGCEKNQIETGNWYIYKDPKENEIRAKVYDFGKIKLHKSTWDENISDYSFQDLYQYLSGLNILNQSLNVDKENFGKLIFAISSSLPCDYAEANSTCNTEISPEKCKTFRKELLSFLNKDAIELLDTNTRQDVETKLKKVGEIFDECGLKFDRGFYEN